MLSKQHNLNSLSQKYFAPPVTTFLLNLRVYKILQNWRPDQKGESLLAKEWGGGRWVEGMTVLQCIAMLGIL